MIFSLTGESSIKIPNRLSCVILRIGFGLLLSSCGVFICYEKGYKIYTMEAKIVSEAGVPIKDAKFYCKVNGHSLFRQNGEFLGGDGKNTDFQGQVLFERATQNYSSCESAPDFSSLAPMSILVVHPEYDSAKVTFSSKDLDKATFRDGRFALQDIVLRRKKEL